MLRRVRSAEGGVMGETEKLIAEIATRFLLAHVEKSGLTNDPAYPARALTYAKAIVNGAQKKEPRP